MKKVLSLLLSLLLLVGLLAACANDQGQEEGQQNQETQEGTEGQDAQTPDTTEETTTIRLGGLKGPTSMGMVKLLDDAERGASKSQIAFTPAVTADELTPLLLKGELDILAVPANLGSILYNNSDGAVRFAAINTLGVIYILEKGEQTIADWEDLRGQTIYATGKGTTPEFALNYLLAQHGLDPQADVTIEWTSEPPEIVTLMSTTDHIIAMMPQPFVTVAQNTVEDLNIVLDLTEEWNALDNGSQFITAGLIVRTEFAEAYPQQLATFLEDYAASTAYVNENVEEAAALVEKYDIVKADIAQKAIPYCNITYIDGEAMKEALSGYLQVLYDQNPDSVGGQMPGDDFYYIP